MYKLDRNTLVRHLIIIAIFLSNSIASHLAIFYKHNLILIRFNYPNCKPFDLNAKIHKTINNKWESIKKQSFIHLVFQLLIQNDKFYKSKTHNLMPNPEISYNFSRPFPRRP